MIPGPVPVLRPDAGTGYPRLLAEDGARWRGLVGAPVAIALFVLLAGVVSPLVVSLAWVLGGRAEPYAVLAAAAARAEVPAGLVASNLGLAAAVPVAALVVLLVHRRSPRWLVSVLGAVRWRYLLACLLVAPPALLAVFALSTLAEGTPLTWQPQPGVAGFLVVIVLTGPLQAVAEEVLFRGYLLQALGSVVASPWFGVVGSALVFALFHGSQNVWLFLDRFAFGIVAGVLVWRTGGLEAACAAHVVNNLLAFGLAALTSSVAQARALQEVGPLQAVLDVTGFALFAVLAWLVGRRMALHTVTPTAPARPV
ncbi:CPBP family intramembrane glutamic endopeptidase [Auraticoccus monumenti]|uniref:CAAX prenyl protease 2/Lysostaphin resistance protein A-like domain-containing protein n=1 Tax=Auraticoccus monumenti TaxID=675864 RepID=A0A1G7CPC8_9ACTN|nr:CPBP family intramembrane glutamic endopeptidase [Auraticoccus monumenti]SDE41177.1 hypothetical protein SAMN04489747_3335 [Auraticoccus monumenti]